MRDYALLLPARGEVRQDCKGDDWLGAVADRMRCGMEERDFFDEKAEQRTHVMTCPHCGQQGEYQIDWIVRKKKAQLPRGADDRDRARFAKAQSYMVRRDDPMGCKNVRCRKRFDVVGIQSVAFI
jgi:hypothetical protein